MKEEIVRRACGSKQLFSATFCQDRKIRIVQRLVIEYICSVLVMNMRCSKGCPTKPPQNLLAEHQQVHDSIQAFHIQTVICRPSCRKGLNPVEIG
jgi:hypothetical protein